MSPVKKAQATSEMGVSPQLADPVLLKKLNEQNIWEILSTLPGEYSKQDIVDYLKFRSEQLNDLVQDFKTMSVYSEPPDFSQMKIPEMNKDAALTKEDQEELAKMIGEMGKRAAPVEKASTSGAVGGRAKFSSGGKAAHTPQITGDVILQGAQMTKEDADALLDALSDRWFDLQMNLDLKSKNQELWNDLQKLIALARSGKIDAVWIVIALAKVTSSKSGFLFTQHGKRLMRLNQEATKVTNDLYSSNLNTLHGAADLQVAQQRLREIQTSQQFLLNDMQKMTQNIETALNFAKSSMDEIFRTKLQIINAPFKSL